MASNVKNRQSIKPKGLQAPFSGKRGVSRKKTAKQTHSLLYLAQTQGTTASGGSRDGSPLYPITESAGTLHTLLYLLTCPLVANKKVSLEDMVDWNQLLDFSHCDHGEVELFDGFLRDQATDILSALPKSQPIQRKLKAKVCSRFLCSS